MVDKCIGSAHCDNYEEVSINMSARAEREVISQMMPNHKAEIVKQSKAEPKIERPSAAYCEYFPIGSRVIHEQLGRGTVKDHDKGKLTILFVDGTEKRLDPKTCFESGNLMVVQ